MNFIDPTGLMPWKLYKRAKDATTAFVKKQNPKTHKGGRERGAFIYEVKVRLWGKTVTRYLYPYVIKGGHSDVVVGFITGYAVSTIKVDYGLGSVTVGAMAFAHTHPHCAHDGENFSDPDKLLSWLPKIKNVYLGMPLGKLKKMEKFGANIKTISKKMPKAKDSHYNINCDLA